MRMWMVNPVIMCKKHIGGEHVECHMFDGSFNRRIQVNGYVNNNLLELKSLIRRHDVLASELVRRKNLRTDKIHNHDSPLISINADYLPQHVHDYVIDRKAAFLDLINRCNDCYYWFLKYYDILDPLDAFYVLNYSSETFNEMIERDKKVEMDPNIILDNHHTFSALVGG